MQLTYLFHSGFVFETDRCILVFDYWMDPAGAMSRYLESSKLCMSFPAISTKIISTGRSLPGEPGKQTCATFFRKTF